ncbi:MAG: isopentenyl phosphate kinase family protein [Candidatus Viridilinea halotolerans]|uniref:Isopentenyl phosphate kinase n=1 Tax=Candidatus Viridilinea halotolerans TaxID=2491704 RepID=A0A426TR28_9CHLR|nr:MAG: isopentenyl phosphate kinase family protein [Candidatus Viridilinea halotolerans]
MYTFIKFGGSVITDKTGQEAADLPLIGQLANELAQARQARPDLALILGHGSGSFGHHYAARYGIHRGLPPGSDYSGFAHTAAAALRLNRIVVDALLAAGLPALALQPSASLQTHAGQITAWHTATLSQALQHHLIPVIHGDVAFDNAQGSCIASTEILLTHLALHTPLRPNRIILVGEAGVYSADPRQNPQAQRIPLITAANLEVVLHATTGSHAVDVTGGMRSKLELMWQLVQAIPTLEVHLIGPAPGNLQAVLLGEDTDVGTIIRMK